MARTMMVNGVKVNKPRKDYSIVTQRTSLGEKTFFTMMTVFCVVYCFSLVFPVLWLFVKSLEATGS